MRRQLLFTLIISLLRPGRGASDNTNDITCNDGFLRCYFGSFTNFMTYPGISSVDVVGALYAGCLETQDGSDISTGPICLANLLSEMLQAVAEVGVSLRTVAIANSTVISLNSSASLESSPSSRPKRSDEDVSNRLSQRYGHAKSIERSNTWATSHSHIYPRDGVAIRMGTRANDGQLHVHTNGSHIVASFDKADISPTIPKRDKITTFGHEYHFTGDVSGVKVEAEGFNSFPRDLSADMTAYAYAFATSWDFASSNYWPYQVCATTSKSKLFNGKIIAELVQPQTNFEEVDRRGVLPGC